MAYDTLSFQSKDFFFVTGDRGGKILGFHNFEKKALFFRKKKKEDIVVVLVTGVSIIRAIRQDRKKERWENRLS